MSKNSVPKIRFNTFKAFWVEKKIADIVKISAGGDVDKVRLKKSGKYPVIANALTNKGIVGFYDDYKVKAPAVTVTGRGDVGYAVARHENFTPIVRLLTLQSENIDVDYLENQINSMRILNESTGVPQLTAPQLGKYKVYHPEIEEQSAIGNLFRTLADLLASYKDNLANYQALKATMLSKMFPKAGQTVPEIRLDGFEGEWEINKLNKYLTVSKKKNTKQQFGKEDVLSVSGEVGIVNQIQFQGRSFAGVSVEMYSIVETGNIVYTKSPLKANPYGIIKTNYGIPGIVSTLYAVYLPNENVFPGFVERYFENDLRLNSYLKPLVNKGAKNDMKVSDENALLGNVIFPKLEEQIAISDYFTNLDKFIQSHKDKISQLETLKKKLLQDMFI